MALLKFLKLPSERLNNEEGASLQQPVNALSDSVTTAFPTQVHSTKPATRANGTFPIELGNGSTLSIEPSHFEPTPRWKRALDISASLLGIIILAPLFLLIYAFVKTTSPGPAFFRQRRIGLKGEPFNMWKFRTLKTTVDTGKHKEYVTSLLHSNESLSKLDTKSELIPLGKWLRGLCIDELPQIINVLTGSMSLVGPRPDVVPIHVYRQWQRRRFDVLPGITGLWQVSGKNKTTFEQMVRLDIAYVQHRTLGLDLKILLMTAPAVIKQLNE